MEMPFYKPTKNESNAQILLFVVKSACIYYVNLFTLQF